MFAKRHRARAATRLVRNNGVVVDVLHIFAIVPHVYELFKHRQSFRASVRRCLKEKGDFLDFQFDGSANTQWWLMAESPETTPSVQASGRCWLASR